MALDKTALKNKILAIHTEMRERADVSADEEYATRLSNAIDEYVKGATIKYNSGLVTPDAPVTGVFNGNLQ